MSKPPANTLAKGATETATAGPRPEPDASRVEAVVTARPGRAWLRWPLPSGWRRRDGAAPTWSPILAYAATVAFEKGFSIITVPLMAAYVIPHDYGQYEIVVSLATFALIFFGFGLGDTIVRFVAPLKTEEEQRRAAAEFLGAAMVLAVSLGVIVQLTATSMASALGIPDSVVGLRWALLSSTVMGLTDLPLVWLRLKNRATHYFWITSVRTVGHVAATWLALLLGFNALGVIIANSWMSIALSSYLVVVQYRETGIRFGGGTFHRMLVYGFPLIGAGLAMFAITSIDRWFLAKSVTAADIGIYAVGARLAFAATLPLQPLFMWWVPHRIAALSTEQGRARSLQVWGFGTTLSIVSSLGLVLLAPMFVELLLPPSYAKATIYLTGCVAVIAVRDLVTLTNVGIYARSNGFTALAIDCAAALLVLALFSVLIPHYGIAGAIGTAVIGHGFRLAMAVWLGAAAAPLRYPFVPMGLVMLTALVAFLLAPPGVDHAARIAWTTGSVIACVLVALVTKLVR